MDFVALRNSPDLGYLGKCTNFILEVMLINGLTDSAAQNHH